MEARQQNKVKKNKSKEVVYLDLDLLKKLSSETKEKLLNKVQSMECSVYTSNNPSGLLRYKEVTIHRFGILPSPVATKLTIRGIKILPGDF